MKNCRACLEPQHCDCLCSTCTAARMRYDEHNVTRGVKENGENPGYFYAPCRYCGKRLNVGNNPPVIVDGKLDVWCPIYECGGE